MAPSESVSSGNVWGRAFHQRFQEGQRPHALLQSTDLCKWRVPQEWHLASGLDYFCVAIWIVQGVMPEGKISRKRRSVPQHSSWSASNPAKYLPIGSSLQEGNSGKPSLPLKMTIMVFGWFVPVLWVITDNSADGNSIIQASLPHFVWVKSVFSSLWVQLMLTKPGAVCNHTSFPYHLLSPLVRKTLLFTTKCQVDLYALGIVQKSPLCHIIGIHILVCP